MSLRRSVSFTLLNSVACAVCVGSYNAAFAKSLWLLVLKCGKIFRQVPR